MAGVILDPLIAAWNNWRARRKRVAYYASCLPGYSDADLKTQLKQLRSARVDALERGDRSDVTEANAKIDALRREAQLRAMD